MTSASACGELAAVLPVAAADGQAHDAALGCQPGQERQLDLDRVLVLVRGGVELQAGDGGSQGTGKVGIRGNRRAGDRPGLVRRHGQADPLAGVLRTQDDHQAGDLQAVQHRRRELAREGEARVRDHGRRPLLGLPLAGAEQAIDQPVELGRLGGIEPAGHGRRAGWPARARAGGTTGRRPPPPSTALPG